MTRLSTGLRINSGADDPSGLIASQQLQSNITSTTQAISNSQTAQEMIATADGALGQVSTLLNTIRGLVSEAASTGTQSSDQIAADQMQVDSCAASHRPHLANHAVPRHQPVGRQPGLPD